MEDRGDGSVGHVCHTHWLVHKGNWEWLWCNQLWQSWNGGQGAWLFGGMHAIYTSWYTKAKGAGTGYDVTNDDRAKMEDRGAVALWGYACRMHWQVHKRKGRGDWSRCNQLGESQNGGQGAVAEWGMPPICTSSAWLTCMHHIIYWPVHQTSLKGAAHRGWEGKEGLGQGRGGHSQTQHTFVA